MSMNFSSSIPDLQDFIKSLDKLNDDVNSAVRTGMKLGAEIIVKEQKRLVSMRSHKLANSITIGMISTSKKTGNITLSTGYQKDAFTGGDESPGVIGSVIEFGKPGTGKRANSKMKQHHRGSANLSEVRKGIVPPHSHILRGYDDKLNEAIQITIQEVEKRLK